MYLRRAVALVEESGVVVVPEKWAALLNNLAHTCRKLQKYEEALHFHQQVQDTITRSLANKAVKKLSQKSRSKRYLESLAMPGNHRDDHDRFFFFFLLWLQHFSSVHSPLPPWCSSFTASSPISWHYWAQSLFGTQFLLHALSTCIFLMSWDDFITFVFVIPSLCYFLT